VKFKQDHDALSSIVIPSFTNGNIARMKETNMMASAFDNSSIKNDTQTVDSRFHNFEPESYLNKRAKNSGNYNEYINDPEINQENNNLKGEIQD